MIAFTASVFLFLAIAFGAFAIFGPGRLSRRRSEERILGLTSAPAAASDSVGATLKRSHSSIPTLSRLLNESEWATSASRDLQRANVHLRVGEYLLIRLGVSVGILVIVLLLSQFQFAGIVIGAIVALVAYIAAPPMLHLLHRRRRAAIEKQLVEFLPMLASSLRAGFAFQQGVELAAKQFESPFADELAILLNDTNLGSTMEEALLKMGERVDSTDLDMMITAVLVQRDSGGNLSEILETAAKTLRERERIRGDIQTLTASARLTGLILSSYPVGIGLLMLVIMPSLGSVMFTETLGRILLGAALGLQFIGFLVMQRVMKVEI